MVNVVRDTDTLHINAERIFRSLHSIERDTRRFGIELEGFVLDSQANLARGRGQEMHSLAKHDSIMYESGNSMIEFGTQPQVLQKGSITRAISELHTLGTICRNYMEGEEKLVHIGLAPRVNVSKNLEGEVTTKVRSTQQSRRYNAEKRGKNNFTELRFVDGGSVTLPGISGYGLISSTQTNYEATGTEDAVETFNYSQMLVAPFIAAFANSGFLNGKLLEDIESRIRIFTETDAVKGARVRSGGFIRYINRIEDYFDEALSFEPIFPWIKEGEMFDHLNATFCPWVRLRTTDEPSLRVEFRPVSAQPTIEQNIGVAQLYILAVASLKLEQAKLIPETDLRENLQKAAREGAEAILFLPYKRGTKYQTVKEFFEGRMESMEDISRGIFSRSEEQNVDRMFERISRGRNLPERIYSLSQEKGIGYALEKYKEM